MRVIAKPRLREFWKKHPSARGPLMAFWKIASASDWKSIREIHTVFPHADAVQLRCGILVTIFNVGGNKFRLVTRIYYNFGRIYIKAVLTHAEYTRGAWTERICNKEK